MLQIANPTAYAERLLGTGGAICLVSKGGKPDDENTGSRLSAFSEAVGRKDWKQAFRLAKLVKSAEECHSFLGALPGTEVTGRHYEIQLLRDILEESSERAWLQASASVSPETICKRIDEEIERSLKCPAEFIRILSTLVIELEISEETLKGEGEVIGFLSVLLGETSPVPVEKAFPDFIRYLHQPSQFVRIVTWMGEVKDIVASLLMSQRPEALENLVYLGVHHPAFYEAYLKWDDEGLGPVNLDHQRMLFKRLRMDGQDGLRVISNKLRSADALLEIMAREPGSDFILDYLETISSLERVSSRLKIPLRLRVQLLKVKERMESLKHVYSALFEFKIRRSEVQKAKARQRAYDRAMRVLRKLL